MSIEKVKIEPTVTENPNPIPKPPPNYYVCRKCGVKGHYIRDCPGVFDCHGTKLNQRFARRPYGIPKSKLIEIEEPTRFSYLTDDGRHVMDANVYKALQQSSSDIGIPRISNTKTIPQTSSTTWPTQLPNTDILKNTHNTTADSYNKTRRNQSPPLIFDWNNSLGVPLIQNSDAPIKETLLRPQYNRSHFTSWDEISKLQSASNQESAAAMMQPTVNNALLSSVKCSMSPIRFDQPTQMFQVKPPIATHTASIDNTVPPVIIDETLTQNEELRILKLDYFRQLERSMQPGSEGVSLHYNNPFSFHRNEYDSRIFEHPRKDDISNKYYDDRSLSRREDKHIMRSRSRDRKSRDRKRSRSRRRHRERSRPRDIYRSRSRSRGREKRHRKRSCSRSDTRTYTGSSRTRKDVDGSRSRRYGERKKYRTTRYDSESRYGRDKSNDQRRRNKSIDTYRKRNSKPNPNDDAPAVRNVQPYSIQLD